MKLLLKHSSLLLCAFLLLSCHASAQEFTKIKQHTNLNIDEFISKIESGGDFSSMKVGLSDTLRIGNLEIPSTPTSNTPFLAFNNDGIPLFFDHSKSSTYGTLEQNSSSSGLLTNWRGTEMRGLNFSTSAKVFATVKKDNSVGTNFRLDRAVGQDTLIYLSVKARFGNTLLIEDESIPELNFSGCSKLAESSSLYKSSLILSDTSGVFQCATQLWRRLNSNSGNVTRKVAVNSTRIAVAMNHQGEVLVFGKDTLAGGDPLCNQALAIADQDLNPIRTIKLSNVAQVIDVAVDAEGYTYCLLFINASRCTSTSFQIDGESIPPANITTPSSNSIVALRFKPDGTRDWMHVLDAGTQTWSYLNTRSSLMGSYDAHYTSYLYVRNVTNANLEPLGSKKQVFYAIDRTGEKLVWDSVSSVASGYEMMSLIGLDSAVQIFNLTTGAQKFGDHEFPRRTVPGTRNLNIVNWQPFFNLNTSRESFSKPKAYQVVPNPSKGSFQIMGLSGVAQVELCSLDGRLIEALSYSPGAEVSSLVHLSSGIYLLKVTEDFKTSTLKVVKQ